MLFSQRYGYTKIKDIIQIESIDTDLRNGLWDSVSNFYLQRKKIINRQRKMDSYIIKKIWHDFFKIPIDEISRHDVDTYNQIKKYFFDCQWYEVYDFIEFISSDNNIESDNNIKFREFCNKILERENSGYRFVDECITEITSEHEIKSIENAMNSSNKFKPVHIHLNAALKLMSDKRNPDYRNSVKESISAVEALCIIISEDQKATLGKALKIIDNKHNLHSALKGAFDKLYGYTSDADGIRHALLEESDLTYQDALYMLVTCSAFVNYLIDKTK